MADTAVAITAGVGTNIDTRTEATNGNHRQVIVVGDPATNAGVAPVDATNGLAVQVIPALPAGTNNIGDVDVLTINGVAPAFGSGATGATVLRTVLTTDSPGIIATGSQASPSADYLSSVVAGDIAHDAVDSGNPAKLGAKATASLSGATMVAAADRTNLFSGIDGVLINRPHTNLEDIVTGTATNTDGTSTSCIAAQAAGIKTYLTSIVLCNTSATAVTVEIKDGATAKLSLPLPAGSGCIFNPPVPIPGTAATAWNFDPSTAATTVTCSMVGFKSKV